MDALWKALSFQLCFSHGFEARGFDAKAESCKLKAESSPT